MAVSIYIYTNIARGFPFLHVLSSIHSFKIFLMIAILTGQNHCGYCSHAVKRHLLFGRKFNSVQLLSHVWLFATPWTAAYQASLSITYSQSCSNSCPSSQWCHPTVSSSVVPFCSCLQSFLTSGFFFFFQGLSSFHQVAKVLEFQLQHQSFQWIFRTYFL